MIAQPAARRTMSAVFRFAVLLALCTPACGPGSSGPQWEVVFDDLDVTLFSVWGTNERDVWVVGADGGDGPRVMHYDGSAWSELETGATGDLWWASGLNDAVWMAGEDGLVLRYSREDATFEVLPTPGTPTLFGIFPLADDDVWAVGGDVIDNTPVAYHFDGATWTDVTDELPDAALDAPFFKVWGTATNDLWIVGRGANALHYDGEWRVLPTPMGRPLFTVHGNDSFVAAVGGSVSGALVESADGTKWVDETPTGSEQLNGVWVSEDSSAVAVGNTGAIWNRDTSGVWTLAPDLPQNRWDYHSAYVDPAGGEWAVGGMIVTEPFDSGILAHRGERISSSLGD